MNTETRTRNKVAILLPRLCIGGAERLALAELQYLHAHSNCSIELHVVHEAGPLLGDFTKIGVPIKIWNTPHRDVRLFINFVRLLAYLKKERFTLIHSHLHWWGAWLGILGNIRKITTFHIMNSPKTHLANAKFYDKVICCGQRVFDMLRMHISEDRLVVVNNAVPIPEIVEDEVQAQRDRTRNKIGITQSNTAVLSIGRLVHQKGYDILLDAFSMVSREHPQAMLIIAGDGQERARLEQQAQRLGIGEKVKFLGVVMDVAQLYLASDMYVNSSRYEGLPMTLLEAMSYKKCVIASAIAENAEIIDHGKTGMTALPEDPGSLAQTMSLVIADRDLRDMLGQAGYEFLRNNYSIDKHCKALEEIYLAQ